MAEVRRPDLEPIIRAAPPEARPVVRRLTELESAAFLSPSQMHELNRLRKEVAACCPEVNGALARAFMGSIT